MSTKTCTKCRADKPLSEFYINKGGKRPGLVASECKACKSAYGKAHYETPDRKARVLKWSEQRYRELRDQVFAHYGSRCACCGEAEPLFLTIDHVNNDGAEHRKSMAKEGSDYRGLTGKRTYYWIVRHGFPEGFQLLCSNCNHGKHRNGGVCPHKTSEGSTTIPKGSTPQAIGGGSAEPLTNISG